MVKTPSKGKKPADTFDHDDDDLDLSDMSESKPVASEGLPVDHLDDYQRKTHETALYPGNDRTANNKIALSYAALGFAGEAGEIADEVIQNHAGDFRRDRFIKELGDDYWYAARMAWHLRVSLSACVTAALESSEGEVIGHSGDDTYYTLRLVSYTGKAADLAKKVVRDDLDLMDEQSSKRADMIVLIGAAVICLQRLGAVYDIPSQVVTDRNLEKLLARREAGTLHGSGSER